VRGGETAGPASGGAGGAPGAPDGRRPEGGDSRPVERDSPPEERPEGGPGRGRTPPGPEVVLRRQLALVRRRRGHLLLAGSLLVALMVWGTLRAVPPGASVSLSRIAVVSTYGLLQILAALWPLAVWAGEEPSRRDYHWSLPVERRLHDLARAAAGGGWLLATVVAGGVVGMAAGGLNRGGFDPTGTAPGSPLLLLSMLLGLLVLYLLASLPTLVSDRPLRWIVGVPFGYLGVRGIVRATGPEWLRLVVEAPGGGSWGVGAALGAPWTLARREALRSAGVAPGTAVGSAWLALGLWLLLAAAALVAASARIRGNGGR